MNESELEEMARSWLLNNSNDEAWLDAGSNRVKIGLGELLVQVYELGFDAGEAIE